MSCSNNYKLQCSNIQNVKKYRVLHNVLLILKLVSILSLLVMMWKLWFVAISIGIYIISMIIAYFSAKMTYDYEYFIDANRLKVTKLYKNNKHTTIFNELIDDIESCKRIKLEEVDFNSKNCWVVKDYNSEFYLRIKCKNEYSYILSDKYFYSLLMENK